jgi:hypothetical protein
LREGVLLRTLIGASAIPGTMAVPLAIVTWGIPLGDWGAGWSVLGPPRRLGAPLGPGENVGGARL